MPTVSYHDALKHGETNVGMGMVPNRQKSDALSPERIVKDSEAVPSLDLSGLRESIDKACETIDYLREREAELKLLLQKIVLADTRYQSAQIALRADGRFANMQEAEVASEKMRAAIEDARKALS